MGGGDMATKARTSECGAGWNWWRLDTLCRATSKWLTAKSSLVRANRREGSRGEIRQESYAAIMEE